MDQRFYRFLFQKSANGSYNQVSSEIIRSIVEIHVEQEMDMAWQCRIKLRIKADEKGNWTDEHRELMKPFIRIRIEIGYGIPPYIPLIDGPVVGHDISMSSEPGNSFATITVQDDSIFLNQDQSFEMFEGKKVQEIVDACFKIAKDKITPQFIDRKNFKIPEITMQRGSPIELLREIGMKQGIHTYVLPGHEKGKSIGCFQTLKSHSTNQGSLLNAGNYQPLILLGKERNIDSFDARTDAQAPTNVMVVSFSPNGKDTSARTTSPSSLDLVGNKIGYESSINTPTRLPPAYSVGPIEENQSDSAIAERNNYSIEATGTINTTIYPDILQPYSTIQVKGVGPEYTGEYLITAVTHTITPAKYTQSFKLKGSALAG
ncbi:MAG: hypothetical protein ACFFED_03185 [Candidatus Thorarchaeota archaeon]